MVVVSGPSGSGKSKLVESFRDTVMSTTSESWFVSGKFDQYTGRNDPYSAIIIAVTNLIDLIANNGKEKSYEAGVKAAIKDQEIAFATLIPNLGVITSTQYEVTSLRTKTLDFRSFKLAFNDLLLALSRRERPLVLFLDDLQWMDGASLDLLATAVSTRGNESTSSYDTCLVLIGAIRQEDPRTSQVMERIIPSVAEEEENEKNPFVHVTIGNLGEMDVSRMVSSALGMPTSECTSLGRLVHQKTNGNPLAVKDFLKLIVSEGFVKYDERGFWFWDEAKIMSETNISDNVLSAVQRVLGRLPQYMKDVLIVASFIGFEFNEHKLVQLASLDDLGRLFTREFAVSMKNLDIHKLLVDASMEGIIESIPALRGAEPASRYKFSHDKLQEALNDSLPALDSQHLHRTIGLHLWKAGNHSELAFDIADHLNKAQSLLESSPQDRSVVVNANYEAAKRAISRSAYHSAVQYLQLAFNAQDKKIKWKEDYELTLEMISSLLEMFTASETATNSNIVSSKKWRGTQGQQRTVCLRNVQRSNS